MSNMSNQLKDLIESVRAWPEEDQAELASYAREIEARRTGMYVMTDDERAAVNAGLAQVRRGEFVSDADIQALWKRLGVA